MAQEKQGKLDELKRRLSEIADLSRAEGLLAWDQFTSMPSGGAEARARHMAALGRIRHEKATDPEIGRLLDGLEGHAASLPYESDDASLIRLARREYERATRVPTELYAEFIAHASATYQVWEQARPANDFAAVRPYLEKTVEYSRRMAECFPEADHIADPLIDVSDPGMTAETVRSLFARLREELVPLVRACVDAGTVDDSCLHKHYPETEQLEFGTRVARQFGYDFDRGRQDQSKHPFTVAVSVGDVRITTRVNEYDLSEALFSTLHEAGHAMYEQGVRPDLEGTPLATGTSMAVHESQSRLWENIVGRSYPFWEYYYPQLQATFPEQLGQVDLDAFYRAINRVRPSLIRTDADELTYNLHVMVRFDLELELLEGTLAVKDLPEAWHARYQADLGVRAPDDRDGVLQDVHWFDGTVGGAFQGYTLGNIMSALFYEEAVRQHPSIPEEMRQGRFTTLHSRLRESIYQHGSKFTAGELVERLTGGELVIEPYVRYLREKLTPPGG